jgi:hypothetical protein
MTAEFKLTIAPDWTEMDRVFDEADAFFKSTSLGRDLGDRFTMVACELVENAIKYGEFGEDEAVDLFVAIRNRTVDIMVKNPVGESSRPYLRDLDRTIQWVHGFQDPYEAYVTRMREISAEPIEENKSGLGIVRITYEGRSMIDFFIDEGAVLHVSAVTEVR